jgi:hypothetical protein
MGGAGRADMKTATLSILFSTLLFATAAEAAGIDMDDPLRALGREGDVRVDAQLMTGTISPGSPISVTYQIQNFSTETVAVADKTVDASYDDETRTITLAIGSETPGDNLPHMITIKPGEKIVLRIAATPVLSAAATRGTFGAPPRYVQVKVTILRELAPFATLIANQDRGPQRISDQLFDQWFESSDTIFLNSLPVQWSPRSISGGAADVERRSAIPAAGTRRGRGF